MDSRLWPFLLMGGLSAAKKFGSRSVVRDWNPLGFRWYPNIDLYHATVGFNKVKNFGRLKLRRQLMIQGQGNIAGAGGSEKGFVSTTIEKDRAVAIAVGVNVLRKLAQGEIQYLEFYEYLKTFDPFFYSNVMREDRLLNSTHEGYLAEYKHLRDRNYSKEEFNFDQGLEVYKVFLRSFDGAYDPFFSGATWDLYKGISEDEIGVLVGGSTIDRLSMKGWDVKTWNLIPDSPENRWFLQEVLDGFGGKIKHELRQMYDLRFDYIDDNVPPAYAWDPEYWWTRRFPEETKRRYDDVINHIKINWIPNLIIEPSSVMTLHVTEQEVEIWDPSKYIIDWSRSKTIREMGLQDSFFIPNTEESFNPTLFI